MATASERIMVEGLSLADAHAIAEELRLRASQLSQEYNDWCAEGVNGGDWITVHDAILFERDRLVRVREALTGAIAKTLNGVG